MTTPVAAASRTGGRTSQARGPAPGQHMPGEFRPPSRSRGDLGTARRRQIQHEQAAERRRAGGTLPIDSPAPARARPSSPTPARQARPAGRASRTQSRRTGQQAARTARTSAVAHATDYQKIIAAEFVIAEVLIAITPMTSRKNGGGISPYVPRDMTKMLAIGVLYLLLELLAIPAGWGRIMAWFGGLILLVVGLNEAANVVSDIDALAGFTPKKKTGGESAGG